MKNYDHKIALDDLLDMSHYLTSGITSYTSAAQKAGTSIEQLAEMLKDIANENNPKSRFSDLDVDEYIPDFESTNYRAKNLRDMEKAMNANRVIILPVAVSLAAANTNEIYVSACVINYDMLDKGVFEYGQVPIDPCLLDTGSVLAGHIRLDNGTVEWLNRELYEDCCQTAMLLTMSGVEVFMPRAIEGEALLEPCVAEMQQVTLTDLPKTLFVASLKRLQENAHKELNLKESDES